MTAKEFIEELQKHDLDNEVVFEDLDNDLSTFKDFVEVQTWSNRLIIVIE